MPDVTPSPGETTVIAALLGLAGFNFWAGGVWDGSKHIKTGEIPSGSDFLWAPHIMIYSSFLIGIFIAVASISRVARPAWQAGIKDPRRWVRKDPYLGAVAVASLFQLISIPGDAIWHELFGLDLTAWSPPHVLLIAAGGALVISPVGLLVQAYPLRSRASWVDLLTVGMLSVMLNLLLLVGVAEWEWSGPGQHLTPLVAARPIWLFPVVAGSLAYFAMLLAKQVVRSRWGATQVAIGFYLLRFAAMGSMGALGYRPLAFPLLFLLGAVLIDLLWGRTNVGALTAAYAVGFLVPTLPLLLKWPAFNLVSALVTLVVLILTGLVLASIARFTGSKIAKC